jgi:prepilin-type N-terminal cleavage/methylation domain-containing protein
MSDMPGKGKDMRIPVCRKGFTVVELIITLAILLIAVSWGLTYFSYIARSNENAARQSNVQQNVAAAKNFIDKSLRQAKEIQITDDAGFSPGEGWQGYYVEENDDVGTIMYLDADGTGKPLLGDLAEGFDMRISFRKAGTSFVEVSVSCNVDGSNEYGISSEILILGIKSSDLNGDSGSRIFFR